MSPLPLVLGHSPPYNKQLSPSLTEASLKQNLVKRRQNVPERQRNEASEEWKQEHVFSTPILTAIPTRLLFVLGTFAHVW